MNLLDCVTPATIKVPLQAQDKKAAIEELVNLLGAAGNIEDVEELREIVWKREQDRTTGIGEGLAIPHGKSEKLGGLMMAIGVLGTPIEYGSVDKKPVKMIVLLVSPPEKTSDHVQALGKVSRLVSNESFREAAYNASSGEALFEMIREAEAETV